MTKLLYIDSSLVSKIKRRHNPYFVLVEVLERLNFGKVKVDCYWFDIPCAYYPVSFLGTDIVDEKDIKELNWDNLLNDLTNKGYSTTKYWVWWFLRSFYDYGSSSQSIGSTKIDIYHNYDIVATIDWKDFDDYGKQVLKEIDIVLDDMIKHGIECENCIKLKQKIRTKEVSMTAKEELILKGYIKE